MRLPPGVRRDRWPAEGPGVRAEIEFHLETRIEELIRLGMAPAEAREWALAEFGPIEPIAQDCHRIHRTREGRMSRLAYARGIGIEFKAIVRGLRRTPAFALIAIATFALGIGATTAVWSLLDGVLLKRLPYANRDRVVRLYERNLAQGYAAGQVTIADLRDYADRARKFDGFAGIRRTGASISGPGGDVVPVPSADVSARFFDLLGVRPFLGRTFQSGDDSERRRQLIVLGHRAWRTYFGADSGVVGRRVRVNGTDRTVIGVLPSDFVGPFPSETAIWFADDFDATYRDEGRSRRFHFLAAIGQMAPGVSLADARAELATIGTALAREHPDINTGHEPFILPIQEAGVTEVRPMLLLVLAAVGCLLLITCANLANLVFARSLARAREFGVRRALGAGRWRIVRHVLLEQTALAAAGGALALLLARALVTAGKAGLGSMIPRFDRVAVDGRAFGVAVVLAVLAALASGLIPALLAVDRAGSAGLSDRSGLSRRAVRSRDLLVALQAGLAALLLVGAGLTAKSMRRLLTEELGFRTERIWSFTVPLAGPRYQTPEALEAFRVALLDRIRAVPGVEAAASAYSLPMDNRSTTSLIVEGAPAPAGPAPEVGYNAADESYFQTLGIPLLAGRYFDRTDRADGRQVLVVNRALAGRFFPGRSPVGARVKSGPDPNSPWLEIVGVVGDIRREGRAVAPVPELYYPLTQDPSSQPSLALRIAGDPAGVLARVRAAVKEQDPEIPLTPFVPLDEIVGHTVERPRAIMAVLIGFALLALSIAAVGIYGVIAFLVAERQREIAVRLAIGATAGRVLAETARRGLGPVSVGLVGGLVAALLLSSVVRGFLYRVAPTDPATFALVAGAMLLTAAGGALIPAIRAARLPPALILRE
jgi:predicted permease